MQHVISGELRSRLGNQVWRGTNGWRKALFRVIGVDSRLLEPYRRGSVRERGCGKAGRGYGFKGFRCLIVVKRVVFLCVISTWVLLWMCWASLRFLLLLLGDSASLLRFLWSLWYPYGLFLAVSRCFLGPLVQLLAPLGTLLWFQVSGEHPLVPFSVILAFCDAYLRALTRNWCFLII